MKLRSIGYSLALVSAIIFSACTDAGQQAGGRATGQNETTNVDTSLSNERQQQQPGSEGQEQVLEERTTSEQAGEIGSQSTAQGEAQVGGTREIIKKETQRVQEEIPTVTKGVKQADVNRMKEEDFVALGLSRNAAKQIVQYRQDHGNFSSVDQLRNIPGMDMNWLKKNQGKLAASSSAAGQSGENQ